MRIAFTVEEFYRLLMSRSIISDENEDLEEFEFEAKSLSLMEAIANALRDAKLDCNPNDSDNEFERGAEHFRPEDADLLFGAYRLALSAEVNYNG